MLPSAPYLSDPTTIISQSCTLELTCLWASNDVCADHTEDTLSMGALKLGPCLAPQARVGAAIQVGNALASSNRYMIFKLGT